MSVPPSTVMVLIMKLAGSLSLGSKDQKRIVGTILFAIHSAQGNCETLMLRNWRMWMHQLQAIMLASDETHCCLPASQKK